LKVSKFSSTTSALANEAKKNLVSLVQSHKKNFILTISPRWLDIPEEYRIYQYPHWRQNLKYLHKLPSIAQLFENLKVLKNVKINQKTCNNKFHYSKSQT
jgi:hypothetical protein